MSPPLIGESVRSRPYRIGPTPALDRIYHIQGTTNELIAMEWLGANVPQFCNGLVIQNAKVTPKGYALWEGVVTYGPVKPKETPETGDSEYSFEISAGQQHITQAIKTIGNHAPAGEAAPDFGGAIGVTHNDVEGVDINVPVASFAETHYLSLDLVTDDYKKAVEALVTTTNKAAFRGRAPGEVLFMGVDGSLRGSEDWQLTFKFATSANKRNFKIHNIDVPSKKGWEYLCVRYTDIEDAAAAALVQRPSSVHVYQIYEEGDYSKLLI